MGSWVTKSATNDFVKLVLAEGETFEGTYLGTKTITGANGEFQAHDLQGEDDVLYSATGASLNNQLGDLENGSRVRITFEGLKKTKTPGRTVKAYEVSVYTEDAKAERGAAV